MLLMTQLCGFMAGGALTAITQVLSATSTATTITAPSGIQAGDLIVLLDRAEGDPFGGVPASAVPTDFNTITDVNMTTASVEGIRTILSYKLANGTEGSSSLTGMAGTGRVDKALLVFRGDKAASTITVASANGQATNGNPTAQNVTASSGIAPLVVIGGYTSEDTIPGVSPRTMSPAKDGEVNPNTSLYLAWKIYNSSPADVSVDMDDEDENSLVSCYIQMS